MGKGFRSFVARIADACNYFASKRTDAARIREAAVLLRPVDAGYPLIRVGGDGDGGYLVPDDLAGVVACFSPGVSRIATFEAELARRGIVPYLADYSVPGPPAGCEAMDFERKFLGTYESDVYTTLAAWVARHPQAAAGDLILQMDIEGAEYDVIANIDPALLARFRIVIVEFHDLHCLAQPFAHTRIDGVLRKLHQSFAPVHLHPNNYGGIATIAGLRIPRMLEVTYLRRDRCRQTIPRRDFPHPLDRDNVPTLRSIALPDDLLG